MRVKNSKVLFLAVVLCCAVRTVAAAPSITGVSPSTIPRTYVGHITVAGSGFQDGMDLYVGDGVTDAVSGTSLIAATFLSSNEVKAYIRLSSGAILGATKLEARNPDGGVGSKEAAFTITVAPSEPTVHDIYFDGVAYTSGMKISRRPQISGKITDNSGGFSQATVDLKILVDNVIRYDNLSSEVTVDPGGTTASFAYVPSVNIVPLEVWGLRNVYINVKDVNGDPGEAQCLVEIAEPVPTREVTFDEPPLADKVVHTPTPTDPVGIQVKCSSPTDVNVYVLGSQAVLASGTFSLPDGYSKIYYSGKSGPGALSTSKAQLAASASASLSSDLEVRNGMHLVIFVNKQSGRVMGKAKFAVLR